MQRLDWGQYCFYAPLTFQAKNRRLMFGWLQEQRAKEEQIAAGWSGVMSLPRILELKNNRLELTFAPELQKLRQDRVQLSEIAIDKTHSVNGVSSEGLELQATLMQGTAQHSGILLHHGDEKIQVYVDWSAKEFVVDTGLNVYKGKFEALTDKVDLHLFTDNSVLEVIANREVALTCRSYPKQMGGSVELYSEGGESRVSLEAWNLASIWD
jgi:beta-fructofuranosidase